MGFYGFEAMALILDAIAAGDGDRAATVALPGRPVIATRSSAGTRSTPTGTRPPPRTAVSPSRTASWSGTTAVTAPPEEPERLANLRRPSPE
jgi:hypothetical protein